MTAIRNVLDTSALVAYWRREKGGDRVAACLDADGLAMHMVNVSEFCFTATRKLPDSFSPRFALAWLGENGITIVQEFNHVWAEQVAEIRLAAPALNFGDGVAVALASTMNVPLLTTDRAFLRAADFAAIDLIR